MYMESQHENDKLSLCENCPNTEFFLVRIFSVLGLNTDQKILRIWTLFTQCFLTKAATNLHKIKTTVILKLSRVRLR